MSPAPLPAPSDKARIAVFVSGGGTNLQALLEKEAAGDLPHGEIVLVISNRKNAYALERAKKFGKKAVYCPSKKSDPDQFEDAVQPLLAEAGVELILLAGFLAILSPAFIQRYEGRILNIHPSLIPAFCGPGFYGLKVHEAALARGVKVSGASVHLVNAETDGGPILLQKAVDVLADDTAERLQQRIMKEAEWVLLPQAAELVAQRIVEDRIERSLDPHAKSKA